LEIFVNFSISQFPNFPISQFPNFQFPISNFQFPISNFQFPISNFQFPNFPISMALLISYDIHNNRLRLKIANRLLADGMMRLQKSVFVGDLPDNLLKEFKSWFAKKIRPHLEDDDQLFVLDCSMNQLRKSKHLHAKPEYWEELIHPPSTLFL